MKSLRRITYNLGIDGWIVGLTGLAAVAITMIHLLGKLLGNNPLDEKEIPLIILGAVGMLMVAVVRQTSKSDAATDDLRKAIGMGESQLLNNEEMPEELLQSTKQAKKIIRETFVNWAEPHAVPVMYLMDEAGGDRNWVIFERVRRREIIFQQVQVIYHAQGLEELMHRLLLHETYDYEIKYYDTPPVSIPMLHVAAYDEEVYYLTIGYPKGRPVRLTSLRLHDSNTKQLFEQYWAVLWESAKSLNTNGRIDWDQLKITSEKIKVSDTEFQAMRDRVEKDVASVKKGRRSPSKSARSADSSG